MSRIVTFGEPMIRMTPPDHQRLKEAANFHGSVGGAEANVSVNLAQLGHETALLTALPPNDLGENVSEFLRKNKVRTDLIKTIEGRLGLYFVEEGFGVRSAKVTYDRAYSSFVQLTNEHMDWDKIFEDCSLFHVTGITPALSSTLKEITLEAVKQAKKQNVRVSFDCNFRSKLWTQEEANALFKQVLPFVDICFAGMKDFTGILGYGTEEPFTSERLEDYYQRAQQDFGISTFASTNRTIVDSQRHELQGFLYQEGELYQTDSHTFKVLDRIGGGDSFAAGILHGLKSGLSVQGTVEFGLATSLLKHTIKGDHSSFTSEEVYEWIRSQSGDVSR